MNNLSIVFVTMSCVLSFCGKGLSAEEREYKYDALQLANGMYNSRTNKLRKHLSINNKVVHSFSEYLREIGKSDPVLSKITNGNNKKYSFNMLEVSVFLNSSNHTDIRIKKKKRMVKTIIDGLVNCKRRKIEKSKRSYQCEFDLLDGCTSSDVKKLRNAGIYKISYHGSSSFSSKYQYHRFQFHYDKEIPNNFVKQRLKLLKELPSWSEIIQSMVLQEYNAVRAGTNPKKQIKLLSNNWRLYDVWPESPALFQYMIGWGDCEAGCTNNHYWKILAFRIDGEIKVVIDDEWGDPLSNYYDD